MKIKLIGLPIIVSLLLSCSQEMKLYSIRLKGDLWKRQEVRLPSKFDHDYSWSKYNREVAHKYQLERDAYHIDVEVNPAGHGLQTNFQLLITRNLDQKVLKVESSWGGSCGKIGSWKPKPNLTTSWGTGYFTKLDAVGFLWGPGGYCAKGDPNTAEYASSFPIILKIYDGEHLIGEEQIDFEIFENGIMEYSVMP